MAKSFKYEQIAHRPIGSFSKIDIEAAAKAYAAEVRTRVNQLEKLPRARLLRPYQNLTKGGNVRPTLDVAPQRQGESAKAYRNRLMYEMGRAKNFLSAKTSTREGFKNYEHNVLKALARAAGLQRVSDINRLLTQPEIDDLFYLLDRVKPNVMMRWQQDSDRVVDIAVAVFIDNQDKPPTEIIKLITERVRQDGKTTATDSVRKSGDTYTKKSLRGRSDRRRRLAR